MNEAEKFLQRQKNANGFQNRQDLSGKSITISATPGTTADSGTIQQDRVVNPAAAAPLTTPQPDYRRKSRAIYIVLALFLGGWGIHDFYRGANRSGLAILVFNMIGWGLLVAGLAGGDLFFLPLAIVIGVNIRIWCEIFTVKTDGNNVRFC